MQAITIFLVRTFLGSSFSDFVNAMHITIQDMDQRPFEPLEPLRRSGTSWII